jgi:hypothetical protein
LPAIGRSTSTTPSSPTAKPFSTVSVPVGWPLKYVVPDVDQ